MSKQYDEYLREHISAVKACWDLVLKDTIGFEEDELIDHDLSKYSEDEYYAYDNYFYPDENGIDDSDKKIVKELFNYAWLHHQNTNRHHWQYWVLINDEDGIKPLKMPYMDVYEMVADWGSFAYRKKDGSELLKWYEAHRAKMILHEETRATVERLVPKLARAIDEYFKEETC